MELSVYLGRRNVRERGWYPVLNRAIDLSSEYTRAYENRAKAFDKQDDLKSELADLELFCAAFKRR
jgi:hypothetical protein